MEIRQLGTGGPRVGVVGLGGGPMSGDYGPSDDETSVATIRAALDAGVSLIDTADFYGMGHNELLIREALRGREREEAVLSVKFGAVRGPDGRFLGIDGRPGSVKTALAYSLQRLRTGYVDIYRPARLDPNTPIEDTIGAIAEMVQAGYVRHIGLSEVGSETIRRAHAVHPICDLQIEYSLFSRGIEDNILDTCRELGIGITAYGVLGHGLLTGAYQPPAEGRDPRGHLPWFSPENVGTNLALVENLRAIADKRGLTVAQLAVAWVAAQGRDKGDLVALVGARKPERIAEAVAAVEVPFTTSELAGIEFAAPADEVAGTRYAAPLMALLDSER